MSGQDEPIAATVSVNAERTIREVPPFWLGHNLEWVRGGQGLFQTDGSGPLDGVVPLVADLRPGLIRYPGGSLANTFRWADSIGPLSHRKAIANFFTVRGSWKGTLNYKSEKPLLGFYDFMAFASAVGAKGAIVIVNCTVWPGNPGLDGSAQAAAWAAYANAQVGDAPVAIGPDARVDRLEGFRNGGRRTAAPSPTTSRTGRSATRSMMRTKARACRGRITRRASPSLPS